MHSIRQAYDLLCIAEERDVPLPDEVHEALLLLHNLQTVWTAVVEPPMGGTWAVSIYRDAEWAARLSGVTYAHPDACYKSAIIAALLQVEARGGGEIYLRLPNECDLFRHMHSPTSFWQDAVQLIDETGATVEVFVYQKEMD